MRLWLCGAAIFSALPAQAQDLNAFAQRLASNPSVVVGKNSFALPVTDYQSPDGSWKRSHGVIVNRRIAPNADLSLGLFKTGSKRSEMPSLDMPSKSRKLSLRLSYSF
jgi:hypothetical protein